MTITKPYSMDEIVDVFHKAYADAWYAFASTSTGWRSPGEPGADDAGTRAGITAVLAQWEAE